MFRTSANPFRILLIVTVVLSLGAVLAGEAKDMAKATRHFQRGEKALKSGDAERAKLYYNKAVEAMPDFPQAHIALGNLAMGEKRFEDALHEYETARDGYPKLGKLLLDVETRRYTNSQDEIMQLRDSIQQLRTVGAGASDAAIRITQMENAIARLEAIEPPKAESAGKTPAEIHFYVGNALFQLGRLNDAVAAWELCSEGNPEFAMVYNNLALGYWKQGKLEKARESLLKAEELGFPVNPKFMQDLGLSPSDKT